LDNVNDKDKWRSKFEMIGLLSFHFEWTVGNHSFWNKSKNLREQIGDYVRVYTQSGII
ncbi:hypothetical protein RDWZM_009168, partial [Blomia tropicalis]